jgi:hypothetical protein
MPIRLLLVATVLVAAAGCHNSRDKAPFPDDPGPTSPATRLDTTTTHVQTPAAPKPN